MNQKEGVYKVVCAYLNEHNIKFTNESKLTLSTDQRKEVIQMIAHGFAQGHIEMTDKARVKYNSVDKLIKEYVPGLLSNWLRKDERLNGNVEHKIENPGSRSGSGDQIVKNLKLLLKDPRLNDKQKAKVELKIAERKAELEANRTPPIDWDVIKGLDLDIELD